MKRSSQEDRQHLLKLHAQGMKNREIARTLNITHRTVAHHISKHGLRANGAVGCKLELIDENHAKCSRCKEIKSLEDWPIARDKQKYPYRLSYCRLCRKKQMYRRLNISPETFMGDRFNKVRLRAKKNGVEFNLTKEYLIDLYKHQKGNCFYTDEHMTLMTGQGRKPTGISIDRIDPILGYSNDNVVLCTSRFNTIKSNMSLEEIEKWMPPIFEKIRMWRRRGIFVFNCCQHDEEF